jgi:glycosyltransferase involved in cell wall biosynthesis
VTSLSGPKPHVSVCVPTYNYGRFLPDCIESVLQQDLGDFELIICDDASTDETQHLLEAYATIDPRIRVVRNERRLGMNGNLKRAADFARGSLIKILCADDWLAPSCLSTMADLMDRHASAVLGTSACIATDERGKPTEINFLFGEKETFKRGRQMLSRMTRGHGFGGNSSFMVRADAYRRVGGFDASLLYAADYDLAARLCQIGDYVHTDSPLFYGRHQPSASSVVDPRRLYDVRDWFSIPKKIFHPRPSLSQNWFWYQRLTSLLTARYLVNSTTQWTRGNHEYSRNLLSVVLQEGNLLLGIAALPLYVPARATKRLLGRHRPASRPPEAWMAPPPHVHLRQADLT